MRQSHPFRLSILPALLLHAGLMGPATVVAMPKADPSEAQLQDSSNSPLGRDPFLAPPPGSAPDSSTALAPMQEAVRLKTEGAFSNTAPRVGDSLDYVITVEWEDTQVPVMVFAPDSVDFPGFRILGQAAQHKKLANGQAVRNHTEFIYRLRAQAQGPGKAASLKLRYLTGLSQREEAVFVQSALVDIAAAPVSMLDMLWFKILLWLAILAAAAGLGVAAFKVASRKRAEAKPKREDLRPDVEALKTRLRTAQNNPDASKAILLEMESLCVRFLRDALTGGKPGDAAPAQKFESLLDAWLARPENAGDAADWAKLKELFRHARFAGGYKEPHELQDAFRTFGKCIKMTGENHD